ncbi:related to RAD1 - component of the nucleotide excision repairosome [Ustilago trichophora]|uniref:Related to RAD1 - component of the nucleotide excision repairosome n=1 Tax=Ustilago trichophora TaxID=86804 RepID=A0A5C3E990_9BASI|nr:related to RAD1 - component of the nucleotide excision repairosome [Ustilago trichophora]
MASHSAILQRAALLPFHCQIVNSLVPEPDDSPDQGDALVIIARGLGLRRIVSTVLRIYDSPNSLVILVNATSEEESGIGEELTTLGVRKPGLRAIHHEMPAKQRSEIYLSGGIMSVTSRILVVDMLSKRIPTGLITGLIVLHAEKVTPTSVETFIARIYRQENKDGFLKAFSDNPEHFTMGISPLQTVLSQLRIRKVELWPRFHQQTTKDLGQRKADVIELHQPLSRSMRNIQTAIIECLDASLSELKRGNANIETDDFSIEHAIFRAFDVVVRRQLDPIWHKVSAKTKQLVGDLTTLRNLLNYLLTYDAVTFNSYLETILASSTTTFKGTARQNQSAWLFMDAANVIFHEAKRRVYTWNEAPVQQMAPADHQDYADDEEALQQAEGGQPSRPDHASTGPVPPEVEPVLEENPKWHLLQEVLDEVEQEIHFNVDASDSGAGNTILIMCGSERTSMQLRQIISTMDECPPGEPGKKLMQQLLRSYFLWKGGLGKLNTDQKDASGNGGESRTAQNTAQGSSSAQTGPINEALKRKLAYQKGQQSSANKRRRQRGGSSAQHAGGRFSSATDAVGQASFQAEVAQVSDFIASTANGNESGASTLDAIEADQITDDIDEVEFDAFFGMLSMENLVVVRSYRGDQDDKVLQELRPRFVVMYDPDPAFVRRVEVYRSTNAGVGVRVYFLIYADSVEEQRYLSALRREKESFERLIREKSMMALPLSADGRPIAEDADQRFLRTISSRVAGGQRSATTEPPRIIVDMREFRSSLPSMLHAADIQVIPCTLQVGDYVLTPTMCVERKSLSDLIQSFNSGRLYTQCELMCVHYQHPILLIEFEQDKSFSLKSTDGKTATGRSASATDLDIQSKLVLLTLAFPRLRIIWSSSPYATSDIFADLKINFDQPDAAKVALVGLDDFSEQNTNTTTTTTTSSEIRRSDWQSSSEHSFNLAPQDLLRALPGVNTKNFRYIMSQVRDISDLFNLTLDQLGELIGVEPARELLRFIERGL